MNNKTAKKQWATFFIRRKFSSRALLFIIHCTLFIVPSASPWGFYMHRRINQQAIFSLPAPLLGFYKQHLYYITESSVNPDRRRSADKAEAPRHYIDIDAKVYGDSALWKMPRYWPDAVAKYTEDTLTKYGTVPWHIQLMCHRLTKAWQDGDVDQVLRLSSDLGHYVADAHVPLHTTENYNGQFTGQLGIHSLWESRVPELFSADYDFFMNPTRLEPQIQNRAWQAVISGHIALDSVLRTEKAVTNSMAPDAKYTISQRGATSKKEYSVAFCKEYNRRLGNQVERQARASIADLWYPCWMNAGQPTLPLLTGPIVPPYKVETRGGAPIPEAVARPEAE